MTALVFFLTLAAFRGASAEVTQASSHANPIRKVVTMLQIMQKKVAAEGEKEKDLYNKFQCYCKNSGGDLAAGIAAAEEQLAQLGPKVEAAEEQKKQLDADIKQAQDDRKAAKAAIKEATAIREKDAAAYAAVKGDYDANIPAIQQATAAIEKGSAGSFLQTSTAATLRKLAQADTKMLEVDRQDLLAFLSGGDSSDYAPQSGQIVGILKEMGDEMAKGAAEAKASEDAAIKDFESLMVAKKKEIEALTASLEKKLKRVGEVAVSIVQMKNDAGDTAAQAVEDKKFLANLEANCAKKKGDWEERVKTRADELLALADTIKVLNDDDALELFKKTLPSGASSFVQLTVSEASARAAAVAKLRSAGKVAALPNRARFDLLLLALRGKKIGFKKVIGMIDDMVATLKKEQVDDNDKKEYCGAQFDSIDDKKKALAKTIADEAAAQAGAEQAIATLKDEIAALEAGIADLDKSVAEATQNRKEENEEFNALIASDTAAKELLAFAKNRLNKFYNPKLYKAPPKVELSAEDRILVNNGGTLAPAPAAGGIAGTGITVLSEVSAHGRDANKVAPPPPPETFGAYKKKSEENSGVLAMIDLLVQDLEKEMTEAKTEEKDAQADYETMMADSAAKRVADSESHTQKLKTKADIEADLQAHIGAKDAAKNELAATNEYDAQLHAECDWLLQYFDVRKAARASEIDALGNAKAVLSGADYSLVQSGVGRRNLRRVGM